VEQPLPLAVGSFPAPAGPEAGALLGMTADLLVVRRALLLDIVLAAVGESPRRAGAYHGCAAIPPNYPAWDCDAAVAAPIRGSQATQCPTRS